MVGIVADCHGGFNGIHECLRLALRPGECLLNLRQIQAVCHCKLIHIAIDVHRTHPRVFKELTLTIYPIELSATTAATCDGERHVGRTAVATYPIAIQVATAITHMRTSSIDVDLHLHLKCDRTAANHGQAQSTNIKHP